MRDVAYNTLVQKRRHELHLKTARAIAALYPSDEYAEMIAYHYSRTDAPEAAEWLERAGDRAAAVYANEEARGHYEEALRRFSLQQAGVRVVARLEEKLGTVLLTAGKYDEALEHLVHAAEIARAERDLDMAGRVTARVGMAHRYRGTPEEGIALLSPMIDLLAWSGPSESLAGLLVSLASLQFLQGRYAEQIATAERAVEIAGAIHNDRLLGEAMERRAAAVTQLGEPDVALQTFEQAIPLIEAGGDLAVLWRAFNNAGVAAERMGRMRECMEFSQRSLEVAERVGNPDQTAFILGNLGSIRMMLGDWSGARTALERGAALLSEQQTANAATPPSYLGQLALYEGDWDESRRLLEEALTIGLRTGERLLQEEVQSFLAELDIVTGHPAEAIDRVQGLVDGEGPDYHVPVVLAWALLEAGRVDEAATLADRNVQEARRTGEKTFLVEAVRVQGMVLQRQGRDAEAAAALKEGVALARELPIPYAEARILEQSGQAKEALEILRRLGAKKDVERIEQALSTHGAA